MRIDMSSPDLTKLQAAIKKSKVPERLERERESTTINVEYCPFQREKNCPLNKVHG